MVTSSAVVGSSAITSDGLHASEMAISARCRRPPDSWCGYSRIRRAGSGMLTASSSSSARARAVRRVARRCTRSVSSIWLPMVKTGLSAVIGSWKMSAISPPRTSCISRSEQAAQVAPLVEDPARLDASGRLDQPHDRERGQRLAAARFADQAERLARCDRKADVDDGRREAAVHLEARRQVLDRRGAAPQTSISVCSPNTARIASEISPTVACASTAWTIDRHEVVRAARRGADRVERRSPAALVSLDARTRRTRSTCRARSPDRSAAPRSSAPRPSRTC